MVFPELPEELDRDDVPAICIGVEDVDPPDLDAPAVSAWLQSVASEYGRVIKRLSYVFLSDNALLELNRLHLNHDTFTDIITFDLAATIGAAIEGECYISVDRVKDNATSFGVSYQDEVHRVMVHGLLHLTGLGDKTDSEVRAMRAAEDAALEMYVE